ncbi:MAG: hypothetical protein J6S85_12700 [Methanobrevibacter sp.]|nr:hypothetical protein [Methanobrevibacter sp.]
MERVINKVSFGKKNKLISISYSENDNNKLLESNKAFSNSFTGAMNTIKAQIALYLGLTGTMLIINLDSITFEDTDKKRRPKISVILEFKYQVTKLSFVLDSASDEDKDMDLRDLYGFIENLRSLCSNYLDEV